MVIDQKRKFFRYLRRVMFENIYHCEVDNVDRIDLWADGLYGIHVLLIYCCGGS